MNPDPAVNDWVWVHRLKVLIENSSERLALNETLYYRNGGSKWKCRTN